MWLFQESDELIQLDGENRIKLKKEDDGCGEHWEIQFVRSGFIETLETYYYEDHEAAKKDFADLAEHLGAYRIKE